MPSVLIDGVEYVPRAEIPPLTDMRLFEALQHLTSIQYFNETHKNRADGGNVYKRFELATPEQAKSLMESLNA